MKKLKIFCKKHEFEEENLEGENLEKVKLVDLVMQRLLELKYLDDKQYALDFIATRIKFKPTGKFLLKRKLGLKGIPKDMIEKTVEEAKINEPDAAFDALIRKEKQWKDISFEKKRERAFRFLSSRGFSLDDIYKIVNKRYNLNVR